MSLPLQAVDRLFARLLATYGQEWERKFEAVDVGALKAAWGHELSTFGTEVGYQRIVWALENLPERCPNAIQFKNLCRMSPIAEPQPLPQPKADPARVAAELAKLGHVSRDKRGQSLTGAASMKSWAWRLLARHEQGDQIRPISLRFANEALAGEISRGQKNPYTHNAQKAEH